MELTKAGIVSYAGLNRELLISQGKAAFAEADPPVAKRFEAFLPFFPIELVQNMEYRGTNEKHGARVAASGFSIDPTEYHRKLYEQLPELYVDDNYRRNFDYEGRFIGKSVFTVDRVWAARFPQYKPFMGEKLMLHLIGGGAQSVAVPESIYPRGGGVLNAAEERLLITQHAQLYVRYAQARVKAGDAYDADTFIADYLAATELTVVSFTQNEIGRLLQDVSIVKNLQGSSSTVSLFTENSRRAERVRQYVPMRYACDGFRHETFERPNTRLVQLCYANADFIGDFWLRYQDAASFIDRRSMTLDAARLCAAYQIAPSYDAASFGGRYPDTLRIAVVRDRELSLLSGDVCNNPAYGDGLGGQGETGRQIYIADSREMLRQRRLALVEDHGVQVVNTTLDTDEYRRCLAHATLQEHKGRLIDAMYRREAALSSIDVNSPSYERLRSLLDQRVNKLAAIVDHESEQNASPENGYDADIAYLRRKQFAREDDADDEESLFTADEAREQSIEGGYAMRAGLLRMMYADAALPAPPAEEALGSYDAEDEASPALPAEPTIRTLADTAQGDRDMAEATDEAINESQSNAQSDADYSDEADTDTEVTQAVEAVDESQSDTQSDADSTGEADADTEASQAVEAVVGSQSDAQSDADLVDEADVDTEAAQAVEAVVESQSDADLVDEADADTEAAQAVEAVVDSQSDAQSDADSTDEADADTKAAQAVVAADDSQSDAQSDADSTDDADADTEAPDAPVAAPHHDYARIISTFHDYPFGYDDDDATIIPDEVYDRMVNSTSYFTQVKNVREAAKLSTFDDSLPIEEDDSSTFIEEYDDIAPSVSTLEEESTSGSPSNDACASPEVAASASATAPHPHRILSLRELTRHTEPDAEPIAPVPLDPAPTMAEAVAPKPAPHPAVTGRMAELLRRKKS